MVLHMQRNAWRICNTQEKVKVNSPNIRPSEVVPVLVGLHTTVVVVKEDEDIGREILHTRRLRY
jgi:hypothetical protein